jgi:putative phosphoesterase
LKIGLISDTHGYINYINKAMEKLNNTDMIIHLGDNVKDVKYIKLKYKNKIINVKGNCDITCTVASEKIEIIENKRFLITHGHKYNVKRDLLNLKYKAVECRADIVLFGHTHVADITYENGIWFINPGSASLPRNRINTVAVLELNDNKINSYIIDI